MAAPTLHRGTMLGGGQDKRVRLPIAGIQIVALFLGLSSTGLGQSSIGFPCIGKLVDTSGFLRQLCGVSGNLLLSDPSSEKVISSGFSRRGGFIKSEHSLQVFDEALQMEASTTSGPALFAFRSNGAPAFAYIKESSELLEWNGQSLQTVSFDPQGQVLSIGVGSDNHWQALIRRQDALVIVSPAGILNWLDPLTETALLIDDRHVVTFSAGEARLGDRSFPVIKPPSTMEWISDEWINLGGSVLRITPGREGLFQLPESN